MGEVAVNERTASTWDERVAAELDAVREAGRWRSPRDLATTGAVSGSLPGGADVVSFASNDYLGLTHHPAVQAAAQEAVDRWGTGTGASRLVVGSRPLHAELERELADWKGTEDAVLFPTGYHANLGVLTALGTEGVTILSDELNHASIVDGCRLARASVQVVRHRALDQVDALLATITGPALVVTDSAFSMDGDAADLEGLLTVCSWYGALLVVDEAHGVLGPDLPGWATAAGRPGGRVPHDPPLLRVGTLSKTLGSLGGYVAGPRAYCDLLRNRARSFIFTTASTPADTAAALAALRVVRSADGAGLVARLRHLVDRVAPGHPTPIVPIVLGGEEVAVAASTALLERGLLVPAIRPPTVPPGTSRLRVALSAAHTDEQVTDLLAALAELGLYRPVPVAVARPLSLAAAPGRPVGVGVGVGMARDEVEAVTEGPAGERGMRADDAAASGSPVPAGGSGAGRTRSVRGGAVVVGLPVAPAYASSTPGTGGGTRTGDDRDGPGGGPA